MILITNLVEFEYIVNVTENTGNPSCCPRHNGIEAFRLEGRAQGRYVCRRHVLRRVMVRESDRVNNPRTCKGIRRQECWLV
jgi:hypothetical protein